LIWLSAFGEAYEKTDGHLFAPVGFSNTISKSLLYSGAIVFIFLLEKFILADLLGYFISVDLLMTKAFTAFCVFTEVKSINESYFSVTGINVWDKFIAFVKRGKEQMEELK
jgi:hypothetical protein